MSVHSFYQVISNATNKPTRKIVDNEFEDSPEGRKEAHRVAQKLTWQHPRSEGFSVRLALRTSSHDDTLTSIPEFPENETWNDYPQSDECVECAEVETIEDGDSTYAEYVELNESIR